MRERQGQAARADGVRWNGGCEKAPPQEGPGLELTDAQLDALRTDAGKMSDKKANELADTLMKEQGIEVDMHSPKHSNFYYKGIPIENHKNFLNVEIIRSRVCFSR